jgi:hypothetical protein
LKISLDTASPETASKLAEALGQLDPAQDAEVKAAHLLRLLETSFSVGKRRVFVRPSRGGRTYIHGDLRDDGKAYCSRCEDFFERGHFESCVDDFRENFSAFRDELGHPHAVRPKNAPNIFSGAAYTLFMRKAHQAQQLERLFDLLGFRETS